MYQAIGQIQALREQISLAESMLRSCRTSDYGCTIVGLKGEGFVFAQSIVCNLQNGRWAIYCRIMCFG